MKKLISTIVAAAIAFASLSCVMLPAEAATIRGDVNGDNTITLRDATLAQKINVGSKSPNNLEKYSADFDGDGTVELEDAFLIQKFVCLDSDTFDTYSPNRMQRIAFLDALNADRTAAGLSPIKYNDAMLEAGNIRAKEVKQLDSPTRPNGTAFTTIFSECNLQNVLSMPIEKRGTDISDGAKVYSIYKSQNTAAYQLMMSSECTVVCVGSIPDRNDTNSSAVWVIDVA